ncbi:aldo/keto reductase [Gulosibacter faecalis]|uniref:Aldo/keto reductase n=1 Tax=Gulosibacter faecalis TaxID=272240 RepID=A0ABW5UX20_9MICO|nr:aldo/keto reductase [Gulosibacter faecalis]
MSENPMQRQAIGFGTSPLKGEEATRAVASAIGIGYRLIDTASRYENEEAVGLGIKHSGVSREKLYIQTKLRGNDHEDVRGALERSLKLLGVEYLDSWLIHWPLPMLGKYVDAFEQMLEARDEGLVRHVGVSNFLPEHLEKLEERTGELPWANQIQLDPGLQRAPLVSELKNLGISVQAWSPLSRGDFERDAVVELAQERGLTPSQVVLAWHAAVGSVPIVRSTNPDRQLLNLEAMRLQLGDDGLERLGKLPQRELGEYDPKTHDER